MTLNSHLSRFFSLFLLSVIWFAVGWVTNERLDFNLFNAENDYASIVNRAFGLITSRQYPTSGTAQSVAYNAINGMLSLGDDPHAAFYKGLAAQRYREDFLGNSGTPGLFFAIENDRFVIIEIVPGGPAEAAGLSVGDEIIAVDGVRLDEFSSGNEVSILLRGPVDQKGLIQVRRDGQELSFEIDRRSPESVSSTMLAGNIGYISQRAFTDLAAGQFKSRLEELLSQNAGALIWDLRGNRGGSMNAAQQILSHFIAEGLLFKVELKGGEQRLFESQDDLLAPDLPLIVLIDGRSLSAAETSALAIRDRARGLVIGTTSGGKGTIQDTVPLDNDHLLHLTIGKWISAADEWIDGVGITPDIEVEDHPETVEDEVLQAAIEQLN